MKRARDIFGNAGRITNFRRPFGQRREHGAEVHFLKRLAVQHGLIGLSDKQDHRRGILKRGVHTDRGVGGARPARHKTDTGLARQLAKGFGHVGGPAFLTAGDQLDLITRVI